MDMIKMPVSREKMCENLKKEFQKCVLSSRQQSKQCCVVVGNKCNEKFKSYYIHCLKSQKQVRESER